MEEKLLKDLNKEQKDAVLHTDGPTIILAGAGSGKTRVLTYEPVFAIGTGKPDTPANAQTVCAAIREKHPQLTAVLYGGSVSPENVNTFTSQDSIDGVLVGSASLDAKTFVNIIKEA